MKKMMCLIIMSFLFFGACADMTYALTQEKEGLIEELILETERILSQAKGPLQGQEITGMDALGNPVITVYPQASDERKASLVAQHLIDLEAMMHRYTLEELKLGRSDYIEAIEQVGFSWDNYNYPSEFYMPIYSRPEDAFRLAISRSEYKEKQAKEAADQAAYTNKWSSGMITPEKRERVEEAISQGLVPSDLQSQYQEGIELADFADLFVQALFTRLNEEHSQVDRAILAMCDFDTLTPKVFLSKVHTDTRFDVGTADSIKIAYMLGLFDKEDLSMAASKVLTRQEAATYIARYIQTVSGGGTMHLKEHMVDYNEVAPQHLEGVGRVYSNQIMMPAVDANYLDNNQLQKGQFDPKGFLTREDAIVAIHRLAMDSGGNYFSHLMLRGYVDIYTALLMYEYDVSENSVAMRNTKLDTAATAQYTANTYEHYRYTGAIYEGAASRIQAMLLFPQMAIGSQFNNDLVEQILDGKTVTIDYDIFKVTYNHGQHLVTIDKIKDVGLLFGIPELKYRVGEDIYAVAAVSDNKLIQEDILYKTVNLSNDKERETRLGDTNNIYPKQWMTKRADGGYDYSSPMPIGSPIGYALQSEKDLRVNGHLTDSYNIAGLQAMDMDALVAFGYTVDFIDKSFQYGDNLVTRGEIKMIQPEIIPSQPVAMVPYNGDATVEPGHVVHQLIGDQYDIVLYANGQDEPLGTLRTYTTTSGKRLILVEELSTYQLFQSDLVTWYDGDSKKYAGYKIADTDRSAVNMNNNHLAVIDRRNDHTTEVTLLSKVKLEAIDTPLKAAYHYPELAQDIFSPYDYEAWLAAQSIVAKAVKTNMTETQQINAIDKALKQEGHLMDLPVWNSAMMGYNYDGAYEALVEGYANNPGWYKAYLMSYAAAGFYDRPQRGSEADQQNFAHQGRMTNKIAIYGDGKWHYMHYLPTNH